MPVPKPLRRFAKQYWRKVSRELAVKGYPKLTSSYVNIKMGSIHPRKPPSAREARIIYGRKQTAEWRKTNKAAETQIWPIVRKEPLIFINLEKEKKKVIAERPLKEYLAHELGHAANWIACKKNKTIADPSIEEFVAYYYELDYARQKSKAFYNALLTGKYNKQMEKIMPSQRKGLKLAIALFKLFKGKEARLEIVRLGLGTDWRELTIKDLWKAVREKTAKKRGQEKE